MWGRPCSCCPAFRDNFPMACFFVDISFFQLDLSTWPACLWCNFVFWFFCLSIRHLLLFFLMWITEMDSVLRRTVPTVNSTSAGARLNTGKKRNTEKNATTEKARIFSRGCYSLCLLFLISSNSKLPHLLWITWKYSFISKCWETSNHVSAGRDGVSSVWVQISPSPGVCG